MKRKILRWSLITAGIVAVLMLFPVCRLTIVGLFRGEHYYAGRPTGYWLYLLRDGQQYEQKQAADALGAIGPTAAPGLVDVYEYDSTRAGLAAHALGKIGAGAGPAAIAALANGVRDDVAASEAGDALAKMGDGAVAALLPLLDDPDPKVRERAAQQVGKCGQAAAPAVPRLIELVRTRSREDRFGDTAGRARDALVQIGAPAAPALTELMHNGDPALRCRAILALGEIGPDVKTTEAALLPLLDNRPTDERVCAAAALWKVAPQRRDRILLVLRQGLGVRGSSYDYAPNTAVQTLADIGKPAVPLLINVLTTGDANARLDAADALEKIGPEAADAVPALIEAAHDPDPLIHEAAIRGLAAVGPAAAGATNQLIAIYKAGDDGIRVRIMEAFRRIGPPAKAAAPLLIEAVKGKDLDWRAAAADALGAMGPEVKEAAPALADAFADNSVRAGAGKRVEGASSLDFEGRREDRARTAAAEALWRIDGQKVPLLQLLHDPDHHRDAVLALGRIGPKPDWVVPTLAEALRNDLTSKDDHYKEATEDVASVLAAFGPAAQPAAPALVEAINHEGRNTMAGERLADDLAKIDPAAAAALDRPNYLLYAGVGGGVVVLVVAWLWWRRRRKKKKAAALAAPASAAEALEPMEASPTAFAAQPTAAEPAQQPDNG